MIISPKYNQNKKFQPNLAVETLDSIYQITLQSVFGDKLCAQIQLSLNHRFSIIYLSCELSALIFQSFQLLICCHLVVGSVFTVLRVN
jgi:hypothetical protein